MVTQTVKRPSAQLIEISRFPLFDDSPDWPHWAYYEGLEGRKYGAVRVGTRAYGIAVIPKPIISTVNGPVPSTQQPFVKVVEILPGIDGWQWAEDDAIRSEEFDSDADAYARFQ
ncbi:MAG: hypothetical protein ACRERD_10310, partial [Candidatus Binatia bacterium]